MSAKRRQRSCNPNQSSRPCCGQVHETVPEQLVAINLKAVQADADDLNAALAAQAHYGKAAPNGNLGFSEPK
jgi:hypothetical protein